MENDTVRVGVRMTRAMLRQIRAAAKNEERTQSQVIRRALVRYLGMEDDPVKHGGARNQD